MLSFTIFVLFMALAPHSSRVAINKVKSNSVVDEGSVTVVFSEVSGSVVVISIVVNLIVVVPK